MKEQILSLIALFYSGCTDKETTERVLKNEGFTEITIISKDDFQHTGFIAKKGNNIVEGTVCSGLFFKNSIIRFK